MCDYLEFIKNQGRAESADIIKAKDEALLIKDSIIMAKDNEIKEIISDLEKYCHITYDDLQRARNFVK